MKKLLKPLYYFMPFVLLPVFLQTSDFLFDYLIRGVAIVIFLGLFFLISISMGFFSPTKRVFDWVLLIIMPISMCWAIIVVEYFSSAYCGRYLHHGMGEAIAPQCLLVYALMALLAFFASYRGFRILKKVKP